MKQVLIAAAVAMTFAPAWAADQTYNVDVVVVGAGAGGTVAEIGRASCRERVSSPV